MKICDLHNDLITVESFENAAKYLDDNYEYLNKIVLAIWTTHTDFNNFYNINSLISRYQLSKFKSKILFGIEDISVLSEKDFDKISNLNLFYVSLTWNYDNCLGGGANGQNGLTVKGKNILKILQKNKIVLDTAHLNHKTFWNCLDNFDGFIINSHTCFDSVFNHKRNINDQQINAIISQGGIIGLSLVGDFLTKERLAKIEDVVRHIDYFLQKFGDNHLCLGTDFYGTDNLPSNLTCYPDLDILVEYLQKIGYNKDTVEKIFYKNFDNFLRLINGT